jgi:VWFA-related protein
MRRLTWVVCLGVVLGAGAMPYAGAPQAPQRPDPVPPTFRVDARLATIDAVVVDDEGRHVTDLAPDDFEILERGQRQPTRQAVYVRVNRGTPPPTAAAAPAATHDASGLGAPARQTSRPLAVASGLAERDRTGRVLAIVVDDLGLSFESMAAVRQMLSKYIDTSIEPGDLVAIIRTAGGIGALQQFTTDRRLLHAAAERVRWTSQSRGGIGAFAPLAPESLRGGEGRVGSSPNDPTGLVPDRDGTLGESVDDLRSDALTGGTLAALQYVLRGVEPLPGRKSVVFVSEGFPLSQRDPSGRDRSSRDRTIRNWDAFTQVMDRANRAGVVVYAIDPRGLQTGAITAQDVVQSRLGLNGPADARMTVEALADSGRGRRMELFATQQSLEYLSERTGGFAVVNDNGLADGLRRIAEDLSGYYLIGYDTALDTSVRWDPNDVRVRVRRKGLTIRARKGLFGPADPRTAAPITPADPLLAATLSPFATGTIDVRLTGLFGYDAKVGPYVHAMFFVDPSTLAFTAAEGGRHDADLSLLLMVVGDNGIPMAQIRRKVEMRLKPETYAGIRRSGLLYVERLPVKAPGGYQLRAAVHDERAKTVGNGAQFVEVPPVGKDRVALSGVVMMDVDTAQRMAGTAGPAMPQTDGGTAGTGLDDAALGGAATKIFKPGDEVVYAAEIYDGRDRRAEPLSTQTTLLREGRPVFAGPASTVAGAAETTRPVGAVHVNGSVQLGHDLAPGTYTLQVSVGQGPNIRKGRRSTQWVDFEVR